MEHHTRFSSWLWFNRNRGHFHSDVCGKSPELLQRLWEGSPDAAAVPDLLMVLFYLPAQHLSEFSRLLLKLATCFEVVGSRGVSWGGGQDALTSVSVSVTDLW